MARMRTGKPSPGRGRAFCGALLMALAARVAVAQAPPPAELPAPSRAIDLGELPPTKPQLALVLSGGGARGAAHIGVLKVLEDLEVVPDLIVGTSMGSIVGGLYAAGYTPEEIEEVLATIDWNEILFDTVPRPQRSFRRKQDDTPYYVPLKLRFQGLKPYLPGGLLGGRKLELFLRGLVARATDARDFDGFPIPFRAVAMDLGTGEAVVLGQGNLADAMRASMSVPGAFPPVVIDGRSLVDGGSVANLPVRIAQKLGAERIIAVNISTPLDTEVEGLSLFGVVSQLTGFLTSGSVAYDIERLGEGDLLLTPPLGDLSFDDFARAREAVAIGEAAARAAADRLRPFAADSARWREFRERHRRDDITRHPVREVRLDNRSWVDDRVVQSQLDIPLGEPLDLESLQRQLVELSGLDYFGLIRTDLHVEDGGGHLLIETPRKPYGRGSLQFGLNLRTDLEGDAGYTLAARHRVLAVNRRGGEWTNTIQLGELGAARTELYQPLDWGMRWFVAPALEYKAETLALWVDGQRAADYRTEESEARVDGGRALGKWGEFRLGAFRGHARGTPRVALPGFPAFEEDTGGLDARFSIDTRDRAAFPRSGIRALALVERGLDAFGADGDSTYGEVAWAHAIRAGKAAIVPRFSVSANLSGETTLRTVTGVGGLLRLSGLGENELLGDRGGVAGILSYYELTGISLGPIGNRVVAGISLEAGNVYEREETIDAASLLLAGALFVGAETPLGPALFGWGWTEPDRQHYYLIVGDRF
jgi:NTE family protein